MIGFIYIMSNPAYPGSVKIGQTRKDPEERRKELGTTGVLQDFVLEYRALTEDYESLEREIHRSLAKYRVRDDREFFSISPAAAINLIREIAGDRIESDKSFYVSPEKLARRKKLLEEKQTRDRAKEAREKRVAEAKLKREQEQQAARQVKDKEKRSDERWDKSGTWIYYAIVGGVWFYIAKDWFF